jgi:hypothetical protein
VENRPSRAFNSLHRPQRRLAGDYEILLRSGREARGYMLSVLISLFVFGERGSHSPIAATLCLDGTREGRILPQRV